jgi:hypothetical protein
MRGIGVGRISRSVVQLDQFVTHVIRIRTDQNVASAPNAQMEEFVRLIWPSRDILVGWPPRLRISKDTLKRMTNTWIEGPKPPKKRRK